MSVERLAISVRRRSQIGSAWLDRGGVEQHGEFLPADPRERDRCRAPAPLDSGKGAQHCVARVMAEASFMTLKRSRSRRRRNQRGGSPTASRRRAIRREAAAIGQPGQRVGQGLRARRCSVALRGEMSRTTHTTPSISPSSSRMARAWVSNQRAGAVGHQRGIMEGCASRPARRWWRVMLGADAVEMLGSDEDAAVLADREVGVGHGRRAGGIDGETKRMRPSASRWSKMSVEWSASRR